MTALVFIGGGPRTVGLLERLSAWLADARRPAELREPLDIHIVDPHPAGGGRIWRSDQSPLLWMNSRARDVSIFLDDSVSCTGPIVPGPRIDEWALGPGRAELLAAGFAEELGTLGPESFPSRRLQARYLRWAYEQALARLPEAATVHEHRDVAVDVRYREEEPARPGREGPQASQEVLLASGQRLCADAVVIAQGHLDMQPDEETSRLTAYAAENGLVFVPPGYTADIDLDVLPPGAQVATRGFGLAFIDAMILLSLGRGGRFEELPDGTLRYRPSGREPVLWVGSRRGVPYRSKLAEKAPPEGFALAGLAEEELAAVADENGRLDFRAHLEPIIEENLRRAAAAVGEDLDLGRYDRPLRGAEFSSRQELERHLSAYIAEDLRRSQDTGERADAAMTLALLHAYFRIREIADARLAVEDRLEHVDRGFHGFFSYIASGPPPLRLAQLLALHRAGLIRFIGPDARLELRDGEFEYGSPAVPGKLRTRYLLDARLAEVSASHASDSLIRTLLGRGELTVEGRRGGPDKIRATALGHPRTADGGVERNRFVIGPLVSLGSGQAAFARPGTNAQVFRTNDELAQEIIDVLAESAAVRKSAAGHEGALTGADAKGSDVR